MNVLAKELTDVQKQEFAEIFYDTFRDYKGNRLDDHETPCPWGAPWNWGSDVSLEGDTIQDMVMNHINNCQDEFNDLIMEDEQFKKEEENS